MTSYLKNLISPDLLSSLGISPPKIFLSLAAPIGILLILGVIMEATQDQEQNNHLSPDNQSKNKKKRSRSKNSRNNNNNQQKEPIMEVQVDCGQVEAQVIDDSSSEDINKGGLKAQVMMIDGDKEEIIKDGNDSVDRLISNACEAVKLTLRSSREAEKNLLILLNKRFATIIEKNRQLELANQKLTTEFELSEKKYASTVTELTSKIDSQVQEARAELAVYKKENQNLTFDVNSLKRNEQDLRSQLEKAVQLDGIQQKTISELETKASKLENDLKKETVNKTRLQKELNDVKAEKEKIFQRLGQVTAQYEAECLSKLELEEQLKGQVEEVHLKASVIQSEMVQMKASTEEKLENLNAQHLKEYEDKLDKCMSNLRNEYDRKLEENKKEQAKLFSIKQSEYKEMIKSLHEDLQTKIVDLQTIEIQVEGLIAKISKLEGEKQELGVKLEALDFERKTERERLTKEVESKVKTLKEVRSQKEKLVGEYGDLLDIKVALDTELATYKALLETEESRLHITLGELLKDENENILDRHMISVEKC